MFGAKSTLDTVAMVSIREIACYLSLLEGGEVEDKLECKLTILGISKHRIWTRVRVRVVRRVRFPVLTRFVIMYTFIFHITSCIQFAIICANDSEVECFSTKRFACTFKLGGIRDLQMKFVKMAGF